jgi:uncharacterized protein YxeA
MRIIYRVQYRTVQMYTVPVYEKSGEKTRNQTTFCENMRQRAALVSTHSLKVQRLIKHFHSEYYTIETV